MFAQRVQDWRQERRIRKAFLLFRSAATDQSLTHHQRRQAFVAYAAEVAKRSPQQVARMERELGIGA